MDEITERYIMARERSRRLDMWAQGLALAFAASVAVNLILCERLHMMSREKSGVVKSAVDKL